MKSLTRLSVLPDERGLLLGVDKSNIFERETVYEVTKVLDTIVLTPIGKYALDICKGVSKNSDNNARQ